MSQLVSQFAERGLIVAAALALQAKASGLESKMSSREALLEKARCPDVPAAERLRALADAAGIEREVWSDIAEIRFQTERMEDIIKQKLESLGNEAAG